METQEDASYGILPLQLKGDLWHILLIQHRAGHWAFPKGHLDPGETPVIAAVRELKEETALDIDYYVDAAPQIEYYSFYHRGSRIDKTVTYFPAVVSGSVTIQMEELSDHKWVPLLEAGSEVTFGQARAMCEQLMGDLTPESLTHRLEEPRM